MKGRSRRTIVVYALTIAIVMTNIAYTALNNILNVDGTASVNMSGWSIYFANVANKTTTSGTTLTVGSLASKSTNLSFDVLLKHPMSSKATFTVDVVNDGTIDAELSSVNLIGVDNAKQNHITYTVKYKDGTAITVGDQLPSGERKTLLVSVSYDEITIDQLPNGELKLGLGLSLVYVQKQSGGSGDDSGNTGNTYKDPILAGSDPNLLNNSLVPVIYDSTKNNGAGAWVVADTTKEWYNYAEQEWANAVILEDGVTKNVGDTVIVPTSPSTTTEVKAIYVWIPRYEYKITGTYGTHTDGTAGTQALPGAIDVRFISTSTTSTSSGYILHPAFTWDNDSNGTIANNEHISGIWVGKFETTGTAITPTVLPNKMSLRDQDISNQFTTAQKFSTYLTNSTNTDSHMMKNSEWGAVAYLSQSIYGKYGNSTYTGANKEVYKNDSSSYYTGRSSGVPPASGNSSAGTCYYDNVTDRGSGTGACGSGSSTTGNIYGVYDMSGGVEEYVMGYLTTANSNYLSNPNSYFGWSMLGNHAGFTSKPDNKYFDAYTTNTATTACNGGICYGHALSETSGWYSDGANFVFDPLPWFSRGGDYVGNTTNAGVFCFGRSNGSAGSSYGFRGVLLAPGA